LKALFNERLMILGADVTHPSSPGAGGDQQKESIAAVTGSLDKECCTYGK
jgi:hypothetical protein